MAEPTLTGLESCGMPSMPFGLSPGEGTLDPVEEDPVAAQGALGQAQQPLLVGTVEALLDERARLGGVPLVERGVEAEVVGRGAPGEAVVAEQAVELRAGDRRLPGLDRVGRYEGLQRVAAGGPGLDALARLGARLTGLRGARGARELVPEADVLDLLGGVLGRTGGRHRVGQSDDGVAILARVESELVGAEVAVRPAHVEGVVE